MKHEKLTVRDAKPEDLDRINDIYNYYVKTSTSTFQTDEETMDLRRNWFESRDEKYPVTVAVVDKTILGWGAISRFKERGAYINTAEISVYIDERVHHQGIGEKLLVDLQERAKEIGFHTLISIVSGEQIPSIRLHEKYGFSKVALLKEVGYKFGKWLDVIYMQYMV